MLSHPINKRVLLTT